MSVRPILALATFVLILCSITAQAQTTSTEVLVPFGSTWKYLDNGSDQGTAWSNPSFSDSTWPSGPGELGYGDGDESTVLSFGPDPLNKYITYYFRSTFQVSSAGQVSSLALRLKQDDGGVVYINGVEVFRSNMPAGAITYTTRAATCSGGAYAETSIDPSVLVSGTNLITVEMHQCNPRNADLSFDLRLTADVFTGIAVTRGPYLQLAGPENGVTIKWRTSIPTDSRIYYSQDPANQNVLVNDATITNEHSMVISGLKGNTQYYYRVGNSSGALTERFSFVSPAERGHPLFTRFWFLGDSGRDPATAAGVRDGFATFTGNTATAQIFLLGDNAYNAGTDAEYQSGLFNVFRKELASAPTVSALGERDTNGSSNPPLTLPYFDIFSLYAEREAGGWRSGTEKYYSFDYGTIHFIALDSMASNRTLAGSQMLWLQEDLRRNKRAWLVAYWHHSPYSKGNHDSDLEIEMSEMRNSANRLLEDYGVDLVVSGHSNVYERTFLIDGHYGSSATFSPSMILNAGDGRVDGNGAYQKPSGSTHSGTVYAVVGGSGGIEGGALNHPAMFTSLAQPGSLDVDIHCARMDVRYISTNGSVLDSFTLLKVNQPPTATISSPAAGATFSRGSSITVVATATDPDTNIRRVRFYRNGAHIGTDYSVPYSATWNNANAGTWNLTAVVEEELCVQRTSPPVQIIVQ